MSVEDSVQQLKKLRAKIDRAKITYSEANGRLQAVEEQLKDKGFKDVDEAEARMAELDTEITTATTTFTNGVDKLVEGFDWRE